MLILRHLLSTLKKEQQSLYVLLTRIRETKVTAVVPKG